MGCHDATANNAVVPNMIFITSKAQKPSAAASKPPATEETWVNLSPYGEWRSSLMGLAGRDPVFYAQLEAERALHKELANEIDNKCLSCHGVMGQRQFASDNGSGSLFTHQPVLQADSPYGALARDGISCMVCHRILADGLGTASTYTGQFNLSPYPRVINGSYDDVVTQPMQNSLGLTPEYAAHLSQSKLCGSCHTIVLPVLDVDKKYTQQQFNSPQESVHEQTTYLEWRNSIYSDEKANVASGRRSCQDCHMPTQYQKRQLKYRIANIEDNTFPYLDNRAPDKDITPKVRGGDAKNKYSRHSLHGINVFVTELFNQNPWDLGVSSCIGNGDRVGVANLMPVGTRPALQCSGE